ncbi:hypothetical protein JZO78_12350 [Enterococcus ureilyticus]|uniref:hypothetical protein n=1 Tax=Enterococcus ureilyticus TaxID=1131292 RepID=UPI001A925CB3|nr:hypothetical protein [Enterococcus ureilyticus]MBO0447133.1 hypothetical protein [Enterococcus ureilyticus]
MKQNLIKITTTFHNTWLVDQKKDLFSEENNILFGDTLRLSILKNDSYYFSEEIALTYYKEILVTEEPTESESAFFYYMKKVQEKVYSKSLAENYQIEQYLSET